MASSFNLTEKLYSLRFKIKFMFGHKLRYEIIKVAFGETSPNELKCCQNQCKCCC
jgi:hypothetical protein